MKETKLTEATYLPEVREIKSKGVYRHFKGAHYVVLEEATHSETNEIMTVYKSLEDGHIYVRPSNMFLDQVDKVKYPNAMQEFRFILCEGFRLPLDHKYNTHLVAK